jgi:hypothetical protein
VQQVVHGLQRLLSDEAIKDPAANAGSFCARWRSTRDFACRNQPTGR